MESDRAKLATPLAEMEFTIEHPRLDELKDHPENYQDHPQDQLDHLKASLEKFGPFRNIVIARDGTKLAGHGISRAAEQLGWETFPAKRYDLDPFDPRALELVVADNETGNLAVRDDLGLVGILNRIGGEDPSALLGTGYDQMMLANLEMVTRPPDQIQSHNENEHWVGLPGYEPAEEPFKVIVQCETDVERQDFLEMIGAKESPEFTMTQTKKAISMRWPLQNVKTDRKNVKFTDE